MNAVYQKYKTFINKIVLVTVVIFLLYLTVTYLLPFFAPFVIAIIIAFINEPVIRLLEKLKVPRKLAAVISLFFTISVLGLIVTLGIIKIYNELLILQNNISDYINGISNQLTELFDKATTYYNTLPKGVTDAISENVKSLTPKLQGIITSLVTYLINTLSSIPKMTVLIIVTLLSTYFISSDRNKIRKFFYKQMPESWSEHFSGIKSDTFTALFGYFRAILILMSITFIEATLGLLVISPKYALIMGLVVAISDAIPVVGTGIVMIPWISYNFITGNMQMALGLTIIYLFGVIIRQILEPKIVGSQIGLHPLVTLIAMYLGLELFGIFGMIIGPVSIIILKSLQNAGIIKLWKE
jgi:sporulation integral membrane protein YtvI